VRRGAAELDARTAALSAALAGGALAAAKLGRDRISSHSDARAFRLAEDEAAGDGLRRIAAGQLDQSIERLEGRTEEDLATAVHETRKSLKRLRTTARLARDLLGRETYRRENRRLRDAGRRLAGARDSRVLLETLDALSARHPGSLPPERLREFRERLATADAEATTGLHDGAAVAEVLDSLHHIRAELATWPLGGGTGKAVASGFERLYRRGRRDARAAKRAPEVENLHELRKRAKDLWYSAQILRAAAPKRMKRIARAAHELSDLLGEDHDLALLDARAAEDRMRFPGDEAIDDLREAIAERRDELVPKALGVAQELYRAKPRKAAAPVRKAAARE